MLLNIILYIQLQLSTICEISSNHQYPFYYLAKLIRQKNKNTCTDLYSMSASLKRHSNVSEKKLKDYFCIVTETNQKYILLIGIKLFYKNILTSEMNEQNSPLQSNGSLKKSVTNTNQQSINK